METEITAKEKARQLVNQYYGYDGINSQRDAIIAIELIVLTNFCQQTDSLHGHVIINNDYDKHLTDSAIIRLKWQQELAYELCKMKDALQV